MVIVTLEVVFQRWLLGKRSANFFKKSHENTCARVYFLINLHVIEHLWWLVLNFVTAKLLVKLRITVHNVIYPEHLLKWVLSYRKELFYCNEFSISLFVCFVFLFKISKQVTNAWNNTFKPFPRKKPYVKNQPD